MTPDQALANALKRFDGDELRARCFVDKYALRGPDGEVLEDSPVQMWDRIAREIASVAPDEVRKQREQDYRWLLEGFRFLPGGRIMYGAGQGRKSVLSNCFVVPLDGDSLECIFDWCKHAARTYSYGGGVGVDISALRPAGSPVNNSAQHSSGAVSFMELFSTTTGTIGQAGRRGALMITLSVDHPDVEAFIEIKNDPERRKVQYANISVRITDEFMRAVESDGEFTLSFENERVKKIVKKVRARELWNKLIKNAHASAEPGLIFWDTVKRESTSEYAGMGVVSTNPCSEIPLPAWGNCTIGSLNLSQFVRSAFSVDACVDMGDLSRAARIAARFLDGVLDYNAERYPLPQQKEASLKSRRIGVGFTGLGDMLIKLGYKYDSEEAIKFVDGLFSAVKHSVYGESAEMAKESGPFPAYDADKHEQSPFIWRLSADMRAKIREHGLRNVALLTVPPVGSGSVLAGCSSGIEPIFATSYVRRSKSLSKGEFKVFHPLVREYLDRMAAQGKPLVDESQLPDYFVTAHQIAPDMRVKMQSVIQLHIDHAISSTINVAKDATVEEVGRIYMNAWKQGLKGITVYREGSREGILVTNEEAQKATAKPRQRPRVIAGKTYRMKTELGNVYVTVNDDDAGPSEVFLQGLGKSGSSAAGLSEAIGRLLSTALRSGVKAEALAEQLSLIRSSRPVIQENGEVVLSVPDAVAKALMEHVRANGVEVNHRVDEEICSACGGVLVYENGCALCRDCGFSRCG